MTRALHSVLIAATATLGLAFAPRLRSQDAQSCPPFGPGEQLQYSVRAATMGAKGETRMWVSGPEVIRGRSVIVLRSEASVGVAFFRGSDRSASWIDPVKFAALRFTQTERHLIGRITDSVEIYPDERRWERSNNRAGTLSSNAPLDVLSYIYLLRTLPLGTDSTWTFNRHVDAARNPTSVHVIGLDSITTPAGAFQVWNVEMRVRDTDHYDREGVIKVLISTDSQRIPVRIQSVMPTAGTTVMTLASITRGTGSNCPLFAAGRAPTR